MQYQFEPGMSTRDRCRTNRARRRKTVNFLDKRFRKFLAYQELSPQKRRRVGHREQRWKEKPGSSQMYPHSDSVSTGAAEPITCRLGATSAAENSEHTHAATRSIQFGSVGKVSGATAVEVEKAPADQTVEKTSAVLSKLFKSNILGNFNVDNSTYCLAQIRATFYPKFENEKSDQEIRMRMIEMVSKGLATMEVSIKHSGSLFMYAGHEGGVYAKNSYGNIYTAVGVFVLGRMFREAWGTEAHKKQAQFSNFLERNHMCVSMELVTAVLGDHAQRPQDDYGMYLLKKRRVIDSLIPIPPLLKEIGFLHTAIYVLLNSFPSIPQQTLLIVVVTAVTELGNGKPEFYSTPDIIAFCREWRLPSNRVWLFSSRKSATSFFAAYDALCEEGTATPVCKALDEVADITVPGSQDHIMVQGEILEGLVARIVSHESSKHVEQVLSDFPLQPFEGAGLDHGQSLREICAANRSNEKEQIKTLLESVGTSFCPDHADWLGNGATVSRSQIADRSVLSEFLEAHPADFSTTKLQEMIQLIRERDFSVTFKCFHNIHKVGFASTDDLYFKMVIHVHNDSVFRQYQKEMRNKPGLWPLYRGFFVDINLFKANKEKVAKLAKNSNDLVNKVKNSDGTSRKYGLAGEDVNLMIKLKFLTYKLRTFLIRNGLSVLFKHGPAAYKTYYLRQMKVWNTTQEKQKQLSKMLDEWAVYILRRYRNKVLLSSTYLNEAEPFLEQYTKRSQQNQALVGSAGILVGAEDFVAVVDGGRDEEGDLDTEKEEASPSLSTSTKDTVAKDEALILFFPGIPGCAKSALCKEILKAPAGLGDERPVHSLMGDLVKGKYWDKVNEQCRRKHYSVVLADKNAPNEEVWSRIEEICINTRASAVPVVPDSEGTETNPFSFDALSVFMLRVLQRVNHPGNLDKNSPNAGYVLLRFYNLYDGKSRNEFEGELIERFGSLVKMPLLKHDRSPLPDSVKSILDEGINLFKLHRTRHGRLESTKGSYVKDWAKWEKQLRETLHASAEYLNSIQVPFEVAVKQVVEELRSIVKGDSKIPSTKKRKFGNIVFAAVSLPVNEIRSLLDNLAEKNCQIKDFLRDKDMETNLKKAHVTLAHKRGHGVIAVANYGAVIDQEVTVEMTALLFSDKMAALETYLGSIDGEKIISKSRWPHLTLWTGEGVAAKDANLLPQLHSEGKATRIDIDPPITITGVVQFY